MAVRPKQADAFPQRTLVAYVSRVERIGKPPYGRTSFEFDAVDAYAEPDDLERIFGDENVLAPFAGVRVVSTEARMARLYGFVPSEGTWVELNIGHGIGLQRPIAFHAQLEETGYERQTRGALLDARLLLESEEPEPRPLGASVAPSMRLAIALAQKCKFPTDAVASRRQIGRLLCIHLFMGVRSILVRDVGQASFVSLLDHDGASLLHFDAGWPISYNWRTRPKQAPAVTSDAPVVLSHWDWDHLHAYYRCPALKQAIWITPIRTMGPGARKVVDQLNKVGLLNGYDGDRVFFPFGWLEVCGGSSSNDSGLALVLALDGGKCALLVGDAGYDALSLSMQSLDFDLLVVTHHGATFSGVVPTCNGKGLPAVVSVGKGNVYKHPNADALDQHENAGWMLRRTSSHANEQRGDRVLSA